jgi:phospholipase C
MNLKTGIFLLALCGQIAIAQISKFEHIVVIVQENRTPDNLFQGLCSPPYGSSSSCSTSPTASQYNIQTGNWVNKNSPTGVTTPGTVKLANKYDLSHAHSAFVAMCDANSSGACQMDGASGISCSGSCPKTPQFRFVDNSAGIVSPYLDLATQYGWANYMFQTNQGPSFPAHQFISEEPRRPAPRMTQRASLLPRICPAAESRVPAKRRAALRRKEPPSK